MNFVFRAALAALLASAVSASAATFDIVTDILPAGQTGDFDRRPGLETSVAFTTAQSDALLGAARYWERVLTGYRPDLEPLGPFTLTAALAPIDGRGGAIAVGGPSSTLRRGGQVLSTSGIATFDAGDWAGATAQGNPSNPGRSLQDFADTAAHEIAHALGFGTLWISNALVGPGPAYIGPEGVATYAAEFRPGAISVPVDAAAAHWTECFATGYMFCAGGHNDRELLTAYVAPDATVSATTVASFRDLGYTSIAGTLPLPQVATVPLPAGGWLFAGALAALGAIRRRRG